jgi:hypothetical protein
LTSIEFNYPNPKRNPVTLDLIPDDVKQFILENIDSVAQLEGLLLLRGNPDTPWNLEAISQRLFTNEQETTDLLEHLNLLGLVTIQKSQPSIYRYQPDTTELKTMVDQLAEAYRKYLIPVTNLIHSKPQLKIQQFADAFKLRKRRKK